jgi:hypothetical protein
MLHQEFFVRASLDGSRDPLAVLRPENQRAQDQQVQRPLQQFEPIRGLLGRHFTQRMCFWVKCQPEEPPGGGIDGGGAAQDVLDQMRRRGHLAIYGDLLAEPDGVPLPRSQAVRLGRGSERRKVVLHDFAGGEAAGGSLQVIPADLYLKTRGGDGVQVSAGVRVSRIEAAWIGGRGDVMTFSLPGRDRPRRSSP